jgi:hypothetical protein
MRAKQLIVCFSWVAPVFPVAGQTDQQIAAVQLEHLKHWGYSSVSFNPSWKPVSSEEASRLENQLANNLEDAAARIRLLNYYWHNQLRPLRAQSVFWLIQHHPESPILGLDVAWFFPEGGNMSVHYQRLHDDADFIHASQLWESVILQRKDVPEVLHNAARFFAKERSIGEKASGDRPGGTRKSRRILLHDGGSEITALKLRH